MGATFWWIHWKGLKLDEPPPSFYTRTCRKEYKMKTTVKILQTSASLFKIGIILNHARFGTLGFVTSETFTEPEAQYRAIQIIHEFNAEHDSIPSTRYLLEDIKKEDEE